MQIKILIVDDEVQILKELSTAFTVLMKGYLVLTAATANGGMSMIREQQPDIIIVDVRLGPQSGMDLIRDYYLQIDAQNGAYRPVFIVMTAYDDEETRKQAAEHKVDDFLVKPFSKEVILSAVFNGISKILHTETRNIDTLREAYRKSREKAKDIRKKIDEL